MTLKEVDLLVKNGEYVITMDPERRIITDGAVAIDDGAIVEVGKTDDLLKKYRAREVINGKNKVIMPGIIDGHAHPAQFFSKGIADDVDEVVSIFQRRFPYEAITTAEDAYLCGLGAFAEMIKHGTTCHNNPGVQGTTTENVDMMAKAMIKVGMRGILTRYTFDTEIPNSGYSLPEVFHIPTEEQIAMNEEIVKKWNGAENDLIRAWFGWRLPYNATDKLMMESKRLADKYGVGIHTHANMTKNEAEVMKKIWGKRPLEHYEELGIMGPNLYLSHMGWTTWEELDMLQKYDVKVNHNPTASMHGSKGCIAHGKFPEMIARGITVTLGHDSASSGRTTDMFVVMYTAAAAHKDARLDPLVIGPYKALEMATIDCARGLLWEDKIGSLEAGKRADVITIDLNQLEFWPMWDIIANLIYAADGSHVDNVIINGKIIMRDKKLLTIDEEELLKEIKLRGQSFRDRLPEISIPSKWPIS